MKLSVAPFLRPILLGVAILVVLSVAVLLILPGGHFEVSTPVTNTPSPTYQTPPQTQQVQLYFSPKDMGKDCGNVQAVSRPTPTDADPIKATLGLLLQGPTQTEIAQEKIKTSIPKGVAIKSMTLANGTLSVDFNDALERGIGDSCRATAIRAQITKTLRQFPSVQNVTISINGRAADIPQP